MSKAKYISYESTGAFSKLVIDYINKDPKLKEFISDFPSIESIKTQIKQKKQQRIDRESLAEVLSEQYDKNGIDTKGTKVGENILKLNDEKTFTICTAHQPNIFTGYLYTIYKIIHAINLVKECEEQIPGYQFVPIFFIGSEDNDLEEIGTFNFKGKKYQWQANGQTGACGRFLVENLSEIRDEIISNLGDNEIDKIIENQLIRSFNKKKTLTEATQHFIDSLFKDYGLLALDADDKRLKKSFKSVIKDELEKQTSHRLVIEHNNVLSKNYKIQVEPRELNLFYLKDDIRERIEKVEDEWNVINTHIAIDSIDIVDTNPEYFSPNVILRPLYQETILPNVAFIGGGSEIAYWMELKSLFDYYGLAFPILFVRNSVSIVSDKIFSKMEKLGFEESFKPLENALKEKSLEHPAYIKLLEDLEKQQNDYKELTKSAADISPNLEVSAQAHLAKIAKINDRIKTKYRAHIKREFEDLTNHKIEILDELNPNDKMQERNSNYIQLCIQNNVDIIPTLIKYQKPNEHKYLVLTM